ncbi:rab3 GTPase-activating protein catalytic subunit [Cynara cardunculus var. scolymus]|uniref:rab3 GTPase-activating protein catalytic subunit n=1 Tax=Cynara cardunculus var. scolymus TaxID=59895 RepID=UPI000D6286FF|nr:rab3 GTPase-activating protein catalytic subunit [Cynara cardunculus var. scolymus]
MASSSKKRNEMVNEAEEEEELEHFDDFTLASSWERFISEIEAVCRQWLASGPKNLLEKGAVPLGEPKNLYKVKSELKYAMKNYCMEYYFEISNAGKVVDWNCTSHDLQLSFGVKEFMVIAPQSASGVILDSPEASKLLSAVAIAFSNCSSLWPAFVPVHDPSRKAYIGIQSMGTVFTRRFEADLIASQVPVKLMHLEGLYELFVSKFAFSSSDLSTHLFRVHFTMKLTYKTLPYDDDNELQKSDSEITESGVDTVSDSRNKLQWDDDCPWSEWYTAEDPVKAFELIAMWEEKTVESSMEMAELENASIHEAQKWFIVPEFSSYLMGDHMGNMVGFASQLRLLIDALAMSLEVQFMEDFVSVETSGSDKLKSSAVIPPPTVLDRVLKDLCHAGPGLISPQGGHKSSRTIKGAPLENLFAQFCLHSLWFGDCNIRAIAVLWIEFIREVRWCWEECQPLPRMPTNGTLDLSTCLVNQKLHMLAICIDKKRQQLDSQQDGNNSDSLSVEADDLVKEGLSDPSRAKERLVEESDSTSTSDGFHKSGTTIHRYSSTPQYDVTSANLESSNHKRRGSAGVVESMMLLNSHNYMHAPFTQDPPIMTEDMHEERLHAVEVLGDSFSFSAQLEKDILSSDMSAFKAANPDAVFEDFIRWHSPKDWEDDDSCTSSSSTVETGELKKKWPPRGRLSERMSDSGNSWRKIWNDAPPLPVSEQKPLMDPNREGEKILHYLETVPPHQLLEQMVCTAFRAAADTLNQTSFGGLKHMTTKMDQLYLTLASVLRPLQANKLPGDIEIIEDIRRLCVVFEHVEKLIMVAASLHRKFLQAPHLAQAIFVDFYDFYVRKMGKGSVKGDANKVGDWFVQEVKKRQEVRVKERDVITNMFVQPSANQSWRKVLSMGNLLNGHEPILREIVFSLRDRVDSSYHAPRNSWSHEQEIETHRMYICGTSNDLRVALSVTSCD